MFYELTAHVFPVLPLLPLQIRYGFAYMISLVVANVSWRHLGQRETSDTVVWMSTSIWT